MEELLKAALQGGVVGAISAFLASVMLRLDVGAQEDWLKWNKATLKAVIKMAGIGALFWVFANFRPHFDNIP